MARATDTNMKTLKQDVATAKAALKMAEKALKDYVSEKKKEVKIKKTKPKKSKSMKAKKMTKK